MQQKMKKTNNNLSIERFHGSLRLSDVMMTCLLEVPDLRRLFDHALYHATGFLINEEFFKTHGNVRPQDTGQDFSILKGQDSVQGYRP